jgi:hypothetical protein
MFRVLLALLICAALVSPLGFAEASDFQITDGMLTGYTGAGGNVTVPGGVTAIGSGAFSYCGFVSE